MKKPLKTRFDVTREISLIALEQTRDVKGLQNNIAYDACRLMVTKLYDHKVLTPLWTNRGQTLHLTLFAFDQKTRSEMWRRVGEAADKESIIAILKEYI